MNSILLLEDEESVNRGISFTLEKLGFQVCACSTIKDARKEFGIHKPKLIICDITLPDGSGLDFIKEVRKDSDVHIICLTALDQEIDQVMGYEAGTDDYITKPFSLSVLSLKVGAYFKKINQINNSTNDIIESGDIRLCRNDLKVYVRDEEVMLTKNEWKLLSLFLDNPRLVLSKKQILQKLFDIDGDFVEENTIAVNIRRLREKIEKDAANPEYIKNIRGIGYIWDRK